MSKDAGTSLLIAVVVLGGAASAYVSVTRISATQADERTRCQQALKLGLEENTPGPGWEVVVKIPGKEHTPQRICTDPQIDREKKQVICLTDVVGVGDTLKEDSVRQASTQEEKDVATLLVWATK